MGLMRLVTLLREGQAQSITGQLIRASIEVAKMELGLGTSFFQSDCKLFGKLVTESWISHAWCFFHEFKIDLIEDTPGLPLQWRGDQYLVQAFALNHFKGQELVCLNRCCLFLKAVTLADISGTDRKAITHDAWHGCRDSTWPDYYSWPNQGDPTPKDWLLWWRALSLTFCDGQVQRLAIPLGSWTDHQRQQWAWFFAPNEDRLYERRPFAWNVYTMESGRRQCTHKRFMLCGPTKEMPSFLCHATVFSLDPGHYVLLNFGLDAPSSSEHPPQTLADVIEQLPLGSRWAVQRFDTTDNGERVAQALHMGTACTLSDGSFKDQFGTSAIVIEATDSPDNIIAVNVITGLPETQSPFWSELAGLFGQVILVNAICKAHNITNGAIISGCDGKMALDSISPFDDQVDTNAQQFDLISAIRTALHQSPITWTFRHIKGHQDEVLDA